MKKPRSRFQISMPHWPSSPWVPPNGDPLERMAVLLDALGNPQDRLPPMVHVAGTNGKGSTIAFLRAICEAAGLVVHCYTSPHLRDFEERIVLGGQRIDTDRLHLLLERVRQANEERPITFFEGTTAAAFLAFSETPADIVLVETGMGGTFDPTNVVTKPRLCIITAISPDHTEYLGTELEQIAEHKAGIIKADVPVVAGFQTEAVADVLKQRAEAAGAPLLQYGTHWAVHKSADGFLYADAYGQIEFPEPALPGPHQLLNAGNAIAAISVLEEFDIAADHIAAGLRWVKWPGRLERIDAGYFADTLPDGWELWFDGGHNMAASHMLAVMAEQWGDRPLFVIFGTTRGKDVGAMLLSMQPHVAGIIAVPVAAEPKCYSTLEISDLAEQAGLTVQTSDSVEDAVSLVVGQAEAPARILVFGSLYLRVELTGD